MDAWNLDGFRKMTKKDYTYDNGKVSSRSAVSRIDNFFVSQEIDSRRGRIEAAPSIRRISDHSLLVMTIWGRKSAPPTAAPYFECSLLREEESKATLLEASKGIEPPPRHDTKWPGWLEATTDRVFKCNTRLAKEKKHAKGARLRALQQKIRLAEIQLQSDLEDEAVRSILLEAQGHMADSLQEQVAWNHQLIAATWFRYGDTCSKQFFDFHRLGRKRTPLKELTTDDGEITGHYVQTWPTMCTPSIRTSMPQKHTPPAPLKLGRNVAPTPRPGSLLR
ncbi:unnamed protein product [Sphagnum balticum]